MTEAASPAAPRETWQRILLAQAHQRPSWQLPDVYKLSFQAALGSEHAAPSEAAARLWLEQEIVALGRGPADSPIEPISPDGRLARVNLRPFLAAGGSMDALLGAFLQTAARWQGNRETLWQYIAWALELTETGELAFSPSDAQIYFNRLAEAGFPAAHHSDPYRQNYHPAYRVVLLDLLSPHP
jgi:hypothetical protein